MSIGATCRDDPAVAIAFMEHGDVELTFDQADGLPTEFAVVGMCGVEFDMGRVEEHAERKLKAHGMLLKMSFGVRGNPDISARLAPTSLIYGRAVFGASSNVRPGRIARQPRR